MIKKTDLEASLALLPEEFEADELLALMGELEIRGLSDEQIEACDAAYANGQAKGFRTLEDLDQRMDQWRSTLSASA